MKKSKSLFKTSAAALAVLHIINKLVDLSASSDLNKKWFDIVLVPSLPNT